MMVKTSGLRRGTLVRERVRGGRIVRKSVRVARTITPLPPLLQGACLAKEEGGVGGGTCGTARVRAGTSPDYNTPVRAAVLLPFRLWGCGGEAPAFAFPLQPIFIDRDTSTITDQGGDN